MSDIEIDDSGGREIIRRAQEVASQPNVDATELFPDAFIQRHTDLPDALAFLKAAGVIDDAGQGMPRADGDHFNSEQFAEAVLTHSRYATVKEFLQEAYASFLRGKLGIS